MRGNAETAAEIEFRIHGYQLNALAGEVPDSAPVHDALCIAALLEPSVIDLRRVNVVVETVGEYTIGATVIDHAYLTKREPNCDVAFGADAEKFFKLLSGALALTT